MNSVILIGRLTRDPELVHTPGNQTAVTHFSIAVDRPGTQGREKQGTPRQPDEAYSDSAPNYQEELPDGFEATEEDIPF